MGGAQQDDHTLTADEVYDLLSNRRRRFALCHLLTTRSVSLRDLSALLAAWENDIVPEAVSSKQRKRVYTALHQTHLQRLAKFGIVEYDRDRGTITATPRIEEFEPHLRAGAIDARPWERYYGGLGLASIFVAMLGLAGVPVIGDLLPGVIGLALGVVLVGLATVHARSRRATGSATRMPGLLPTATPVADSDTQQ